jgi:hypothetical protein
MLTPPPASTVGAAKVTTRMRAGANIASRRWFLMAASPMAFVATVGKVNSKGCARGKALKLLGF